MSRGTLDQNYLVIFSPTGLLPSTAELSSSIRLKKLKHYDLSSAPETKFLVWALPLSLAATEGIDFSFSSFGYLDVSVPQVFLYIPMNSVYSI